MVPYVGWSSPVLVVIGVACGVGAKFSPGCIYTTFTQKPKLGLGFLEINFKLISVVNDLCYPVLVIQSGCFEVETIQPLMHMVTFVFLVWVV